MASSDANSCTIVSTVALLDKNQGIGYKGNLPWPPIQKDKEHYMSIITATDDPSKKNGIMLGSITWLELLKKRHLKLHPKLSYVITSSRGNSLEHAELCRAIKSTYDEATEELFKGVKDGDLERIFVLGGSQNYALAIEDPRLKTIHVTRIFNDFPADAYFPCFDHNYQKTSTSSLQEENGIKFQFEVWQRKSSL